VVLTIWWCSLFGRREDGRAEILVVHPAGPNRGAAGQKKGEGEKGKRREEREAVFHSRREKVGAVRKRGGKKLDGGEMRE
jgi:predicted NUDIX family NTP pyrophosphohydrolase